MKKKISKRVSERLKSTDDALKHPVGAAMAEENRLLRMRVARQKMYVDSYSKTVNGLLNTVQSMGERLKMLESLLDSGSIGPRFTDLKTGNTGVMWQIELPPSAESWMEGLRENNDENV